MFGAERRSRFSQLLASPGLIWIRVPSSVRSQDSNNHIIVCWPGWRVLERKKKKQKKKKKTGVSDRAGGESFWRARLRHTVYSHSIYIYILIRSFEGVWVISRRGLATIWGKLNGYMLAAVGGWCASFPVCSTLQHPQRSLQPADWKPLTLTSQEQDPVRALLL